MENIKTSIVLGLFFGDEGKGLTTAHLAPDERSLVIRFNGGHQAGHTVIKNGKRHVFSNFGSGTLNGAHTYWSEFCTFYPIAFCNERRGLEAIGISNPVFYVHPLAPVTTPYDIYFNRQAESSNQHGSVGVGFGTTIQRHIESPYKLYVQDIMQPDIFAFKLSQIENYYRMRGMSKSPDEAFFHSFMEAVQEIRDSHHTRIAPISQIAHAYNHFVFEGAQGIMLDMDFGFFPHVTRSNTTCKNALAIMAQCKLSEAEIYYVMRSYLTRHGNGYMPGESKLALKNNEMETNVQHPWQGQFRTGFHSYALLNYAMDCDKVQRQGLKCRSNLVISCLDQTGNQIMMEQKAIELKDFLLKIRSFGMNKILYSEDGERLREEESLNFGGGSDQSFRQQEEDCMNAV